jgi:hypothetical protein
MLGWSLSPVVIDDICVYLLNGVLHFVLLYVCLFVVPCCGVMSATISAYKHCLCIGVSNTYWLCESHDGYLIRGRNFLPIASTWIHHCFWLLIFLVFCVVFLCFICLRYVSCLPNVVIISGLFILDCLFRFLYRLLCYLYIFTHTCVQYNFHIISYDRVV